MMRGMDRSIAIRAALIQGGSLAVRCRGARGRAAAVVLRGLGLGRRTGRVGGVRGVRGERAAAAAPARRSRVRRSPGCRADRRRRRAPLDRRAARVVLFGALVRAARDERTRRRPRLMDLGLAGQVALVTGGVEGDRAGIAAGARRRGRAGGDRGARRGADAAAAARIGAHPVVFDSGDLDAVDGVVDTVESRARADRHLRREHRRPAGRRGSARLHRAAVGGGAPHARALPDGLPRAAAARDARARLGPRRRGQLDRRCASRSPPCSSPTRTGPGWSRRSRCSRRRSPPTASRSTRCCPGGSRTDRAVRQRGVARGGRGRRARSGSRPARLGTVDELAAAAVFLCSGRPPTSRARRCSSTAA